MTTDSGGDTVVYLDTHPAWRAAQRRSEELAAAMRRHPSFQSRREPVIRGNTALHSSGAR